jgi:hypothetical protein
MPNIEDQHPKKEITQRQILYIYMYSSILVLLTHPYHPPDVRYPYSIFSFVKNYGIMIFNKLIIERSII